MNNCNKRKFITPVNGVLSIDASKNSKNKKMAITLLQHAECRLLQNLYHYLYFLLFLCQYAVSVGVLLPVFLTRQGSLVNRRIV